MYLCTNKYGIGNQWWETLILKSPSTFWTDVIKNWQLLCTKQQCRNNLDIMNTCFWYISKITKEPLFFQNWYKNGMTLIGDITDRDGKVKPIKDLIKCYSFNINILDYFRVKHIVQNFIDKFKLGDTFTYTKPSYPLHLQTLSKAKKGCRLLQCTHAKCGKSHSLDKMDEFSGYLSTEFLDQCLQSML